MTEAPEPHDATEQARAALHAALTAAARRALAQGATVEDLLQYAEQRLAMLRSMIESSSADGRDDSSADPDTLSEDLLDRRDDAG
jgi:hypothetical protein